MTRQAILVGFALWVLNATAPPYKRATFPDYAACVVAAQVEIDSLKPFAPGILWGCLPDSDPAAVPRDSANVEKD